MPRVPPGCLWSFLRHHVPQVCLPSASLQCSTYLEKVLHLPWGRCSTCHETVLHLPWGRCSICHETSDLHFHSFASCLCIPWPTHQLRSLDSLFFRLDSFVGQGLGVGRGSFYNSRQNLSDVFSVLQTLYPQPVSTVTLSHSCPAASALFCLIDSWTLLCMNILFLRITATPYH